MALALIPRFWVPSERIQDNTLLYKYSSSLSGPAISNTYIKRDHTMERTNQKCMTLTAVEDSSPQYISNSAKCARGSGSVNYEGPAFVLCITNDKSIFCDGQILQDSHSEWLIWDDALSMKVTKVLCMKNSSETPFSSSNRIFYCNNNDILMTL